MSEYVHVDKLELPAASTIAPHIDSLYNFMWWTSILSFGLVIGAAVYWIIKYRRTKQGHVTAYISENHTMEAVWTIIPIIFLAIIFIWGWTDYVKLRTTDADALEINIIGKQWMWETNYQNGKTEINALHVPRGSQVKLIMTSTDVLHSFFIPAFRVKQDVVPGMFTTVAFTATQVGEFQVFCAEYCGTSHSKMLAKVTVMEPEDYKRWTEGMPLRTASGERVTPNTPLAQTGEKLFQRKNCYSCHSTDGGVQAKVGPTLKGIFGKEVTLNEGKTAKVDENYLRESMMDPQAKMVAGFQGVMPTFRGLLKDDEVNALIAYIKSLK